MVSVIDVENYIKSKGWSYKVIGNQFVIQDDCPFCGRPKHFYIGDGGLWDCKRCGESGNLFTLKRHLGDLDNDNVIPVRIVSGRNSTKNFSKSITKPKHGADLTFKKILFSNDGERVLEYLKEKRMLSDEIIDKFNLGAVNKNGNDLLSIPHYLNNELVNVKFRTIPPAQKSYTRWTGCSSILFNVDCLAGIDDLGPHERVVYVCEGEIDAIAMVQYGFRFVVASTAGAGAWQEKWLKYLEKATKIYLVYDNDDAGNSGAAKAAAILGRWRCVRATPPMHDVAECLASGMSREEFSRCIENAEEIGERVVVGCSEVAGDLIERLTRPQPCGNSTGWISLDAIIGGVRDGETTVVTGDTGCVDGETIVQINRGGVWRHAAIREIVSQYMCRNLCEPPWNLSVPTMVRSVVCGDYIGMAQLIGAYDNGVKNTIEITFDNDSILIGTEDHKLKTINNSWMCLGDVPVGGVFLSGSFDGSRDLVMTRHRYIGGLRYHKYINYYTKNKSSNPNTMRYCIPFHVIAFEANMNNISIDRYVKILRDHQFFIDSLYFVNPETDVIFHIDGNTMNNKIDNLAVMPIDLFYKNDAWMRGFCLNRASCCRVVGKKNSGKKHTYDLHTSTENYIANGIVTHNSGKSTWTTAWAVNQVYQGKPILIAPFEQRPWEVLGKIVSMNSQRSLYKIDRDLLGVEIDKVCKLPIYFMNKNGPTDLSLIREALHCAVSRFGVQRVVIDHMNASLVSDRMNERHAIKEYIQCIEACSKDLDIHVMLVAHPKNLDIDRNGATRKVTIGDLKGSSDIKQIVDNVIRVHRQREDAHGTDSDKTEISVMKCRSEAGHEGAAWFVFDPNGERFIEGACPSGDYGGAQWSSWDMPH